jgi:hypothetical protein
MDRRKFLKGGAMAAGVGLVPTAAAAPAPRAFLLENKQLAWELESGAGGIRSVGFQNRISGRRFALQAEDEFTLVFSNGQRLEIPWWNFRLTDEGSVPPEGESGLGLGFHQPAIKLDGWRHARNLAGGQKGRKYAGYGWFRHEFELPESARGKEIVFVLGGYDEQDWNEHWIYVNGHEAGHRKITERWRSPGRYALQPTDAGYASLQFGSKAPN